MNFNLERLVLEYCGLGNAESVMALVGFLSKLEQRPSVFFPLKLVKEPRTEKTLGSLKNPGPPV